MSAPTNGETCPTLQGPVRKIYRHSSRQTRWSEFADLDEERDVFHAQIKDSPIIHGFRRNSENAWVSYSLQFHSSVMRDLVAKALDKYPDLDFEEMGWTFHAPYQPFLHRWERLKSLITGSGEAPALPNDDDGENAGNETLTNAHNKKAEAHKILISVLEPLLSPSVDSLSQIRETGMINFSLLWQILPPGELVLTNAARGDKAGTEIVNRVVKNELQEDACGNPFWRITLEHVDWNGQRCGLQTTSICIKDYHGVRRVTSLAAYPVSFANDPEEMKERLVARGRRFEQLRGFHYLSYKGNHISLAGASGEGAGEHKFTNGRVVIDTFAYYRIRNKALPSLKSLDGTKSCTDTETKAQISRNDESSIPDPPTSDSSDSSDQEQPSDTVNRPGGGQEDREEDLSPLSEEDCLLATPWLVGMDMKTKQWGRFLINNFTPVEWNDKAFSNLVLPNGEKELAWAFVESKAAISNNTATASSSTSTSAPTNKHQEEAAEFDDFVPDKGRGLIILMFGPPGVGKSFTAEAVAERSRVPLYSLSAGMLGTQPDAVEAAVDYALELCRLWNAMLLLDEADIFLGARTNEALARNELVSIFLTKLEYYTGIIFLTTNRASSIDHAFQSRVDLFLPYQDLTPAARNQVWNNFFDHFGRDRFELEGEKGQAGLERLCRLSLNGREIKNLIKSAQLLCVRGGGRVSMERLYMLAERRVCALRLLGGDGGQQWGNLKMGEMEA